MKAIRSVYLLFFFCLSSLIKTRIEAFTCDNGKTIIDNYFCDADPRDCGDGSDEAFGCNRNKCGQGKFVCTENQLCQPISVRCNGYRDCSDGSDEMHCGDIFLRQKKCSVSNEKYLCQDELKCIDLQKMCDGQCDCSDCSDENSFNCYNYNDSCRSCSHHCLLTPNGAECICSPSSNGTSVNWWCEKLVNCTGDDSCDHSCMRYKSSTTWCSCFENYSAVPGSRGRECQTDVWFENLLVYSTVSKIKVLNITSDLVHIVKYGEVFVTALTAARNYIYYASFQGGKASISKITNASKEYHNVIETDSPITSLAVDWITKNIYFINNECLSVCTDNGHICTQLECSGVSHVVLAPKFGWMFYTKKSVDEDDKIIIKSNMDGSDKIVFIDGSFHYPISLSIDEMRETLYWFELNTKTLYYVNFQGSKMKEKLVNNHQFSLSFTVNDGTIFYLKSENHHKNTIYSMRVERSFQFRDYKDFTTNRIKHLYTYNPSLQNITKFANPCATETCNGLCLLRSFSTTNRSNYTCLCQNHTSKNRTSWCSLPSIQPTPDVESIPKTEITLVTEQFSILTTGREVETTTLRFKNSSPDSLTAKTPADIPSNFLNITTTKPLGNSSSTNELLCSSRVSSPQASNFDGLLFGFMLGVALTSVIVGLYAIFRRVYWNRRHQQMSVSELMNLQ